MEARRPRLSLDAFLAREGESFTVHRSDGQDAALRLDAVERPEAHREDRERFTLRFESVDSGHVPQGRYAVSHPELDAFEITIVPVAGLDSEPGSVSYEAVFDRQAPEDRDGPASSDGRSSSRRGIIAGALGAILGGSLLSGGFGTPVGQVAASSHDPYIGEIRMLAFQFAPRGWAHCDGQLLDIQQNQALFSLIGTRYGGNGRTTFALPDLRGRTPIHRGQGPGLPNYPMGENGGNAEVTLSQGDLPPHSHGHSLTLPVSTDEGNTTTPDGNALAAQPDARGTVPVYTDGATDGSMAVAGDVEQTGSGDSHENMPPYSTVNYCIALTGRFPPRS